MVTTYHFPEGTALSLEEYIDIVDGQFDVYDRDSLSESAQYLHRLSLNDDLLNSFILDPVKKNSREIQTDNAYTDATFLLGFARSGRFFVRANVWKVPRVHAGSESYEQQLYSYERPHDHNFDFLTVGYYGAGYTTQIYEYDYSHISGVLGGDARLRYIEETTLPKGKVMFYHKSEDVHTQKPPEELSISINLMIPAADQMGRQQYFFDTETGTISGYVEGAVSQRVSTIELAGALGGEAAVEPLLAIARGDECGRVRAAALDGLFRLIPTDSSRLLSEFGADRSELVRKAFRAIIA